ncbi:hypothetical protein SOVF_206410, partial [Spinacia oleracea]
LLYSWDRGCDVCVDLMRSSPLTQSGLSGFAPGRVVTDTAIRKREYEARCRAIGYGFLPFSFSSLGELDKDAVALLKRIQKFSRAHDIEARAAAHIFTRIGFAIARGVGAQIKATVVWRKVKLSYEAAQRSRPMGLAKVRNVRKIESRCRRLGKDVMAYVAHYEEAKRMNKSGMQVEYLKQLAHTLYCNNNKSNFRKVEGERWIYLGSPCKYPKLRTRLDEAELSKTIPENISIEDPLLALLVS